MERWCFQKQHVLFSDDGGLTPTTIFDKTRAYTHIASISQLIDNDSLPLTLLLPLSLSFRHFFHTLLLLLSVLLQLINEWVQINFKNNFSRNPKCCLVAWPLFKRAFFCISMSNMKKMKKTKKFRAISTKRQIIFPFDIRTQLNIFTASKMTSFWSWKQQHSARMRTEYARFARMQPIRTR